MYCVSTDYLLGRENPGDYIPKNDEIIAVESLRALNGKPVWNDSKGWGIVNGIQDYVIFMDGTKIVLAEAMNLRAMTPAYSMGYSPTTKPISHEDLGKFKSVIYKRGFNSLRFSYMMKGTGLTEFQVGTPRP